MVDLVKIRKKAKKKEAEAAAAAPETAAAAPPRAGEAAGTHTETAETQSEPRTTDNRQPTTDNARSANEPTTDNARSAKLERFKSEAGKRRQETDEQETESAATAEQVELLTFAIAGEQYAVGIEQIVEIVTPRSATRVPNADETVVGIISLRGTIVTLIDVRRKLRQRPGERGSDARIIVVQRAGETLGFEVDRVLRVVKIESGALEPHPVVHASEQREAIRGVFRHGDALTILLDLDKLLA